MISEKTRLVLGLLILSAVAVFMLSSCTANFSGKASLQEQEKSGKGTWAVVELNLQDGKFQLERISLQSYNKTQKDLFDKVFGRVSPSERGFTHQLILRGKIEAREYFSGIEELVEEEFLEDGTIKLVRYQTTPKNKILVKVHLDPGFRVNQPFEVRLKELKSGKEEIVLTKKDSIAFSKRLERFQVKPTSLKPGVPGNIGPEKSLIKITGKATEPSPEENQNGPYSDEQYCDNLQEVIPGHNDKNDLGRTNIIFVGFGYPNLTLFTEGLPYYLDLTGEGFKYYILPKNYSLYFIPESYSLEGYFNELFGKSPLHLVHGLFYFVPFLGNENKFNFWYLDQLQPLAIEAGKCFSEDLKTGYLSFYGCQLPHLKNVALCLKTGTSSAGLDGSWTTVYTGINDSAAKTTGTESPEEEKEVDFENKSIHTFDNPNILLKTDQTPLLFKPGSTEVFVHEFGHLFGNLRDEYLKGGGKPDLPGHPNCAPTKSLGAVWWKEIFPKLDYWNGCAYVNDNVRFSDNSLMRDQVTSTKNYGSQAFREINQFYLCYKIFEKYGSVEGDFCNSLFFESYVPPQEDCSDGKDNDGDEKIDCFDENCYGKLSSTTKGTYVCCKYDSDCPAIRPLCVFSTQTCGVKEEANFYVKPSSCSDKKDNDNNGEIDCADQSCIKAKAKSYLGYSCCQTEDDCYSIDEMGTYTCVANQCLSYPSCEDQLTQGNGDQYCAMLGYSHCIEYGGNGLGTKKFCVPEEDCDNQIDDDLDGIVDKCINVIKT